MPINWNQIIQQKANIPGTISKIISFEWNENQAIVINNQVTLYAVRLLEYNSNTEELMELSKFPTITDVKDYTWEKALQRAEKIKNEQELLYLRKMYQTSREEKNNKEEKEQFKDKKKTAISEAQEINDSLSNSLFKAVEKNDIRAVKSIIREGKININTYDEKGEFTPLHIAVAREYPEIVVILLEARANPNVEDIEGNKPMHFAAEGNNLSLLELLARYGGDVNAVNKYGWSVLHSAASGIIKEGEDWEIIEWLLQQKGIKIDGKADNGFTIRDVFLQKDYSYAKIYDELVKKKEAVAEFYFNQQLDTSK